MANSSTLDTHKPIGLLLIGGHHHILHLVPIASGLDKIDGVNVVIFVTNEREREVCASVLSALGLKHPNIQVLRANRILQRLSPKLAFLLSNIKIWKSLEALIVVERTSTILRYFMRKMPKFIHIPHGAGDRAKSYDSRIRHFDHVLVAGEKDKIRMIDLGLVSEKSCDVTGYIKPYAVKIMAQALPVLFEDDKPIVFYNPHFSKSLSSWDMFGRDLLDAFVQASDFNFIVAPHMRLFKGVSEALRRDIEAYGAHDNIHIDLGSERSTDMSYTRYADIYLGDVSSQVYEFLSEPKPCVFIGSPEVDWEDNLDYAHWNYGRVCHSAAEVVTALDEAREEHALYRSNQVKGCIAAKGDSNWNPIERAAQSVRKILQS